MANYVYENMPANGIPFLEESPQSVYQQWLSQQGLGYGNAYRLQNQFGDIWSRYLFDLAKDPVNVNTFGDYLSNVSPRNELAQFGPEMRGFEPRRYQQPVRWITF